MGMTSHDGGPGAAAGCAGRRLLLCAGIMAACVPEAAASCPTQQFGAARHSPAGTNLGDLAAADLDGDGLSDLAVANAASPGVISLLFGNGGGGFAAPVGQGVGNFPFQLTVGDFNGDGNPDLAAANRDSGTVSIRLGTGGGGYGPRADFAVGSLPLGISTGDFNGDGVLDLAVSNAGSGSVSILMGTGTGAFTAAAAVAVGAGPRDIAVGDLDQDGRQDLLVANYDSNSVSVRLGLGNGAFTAAPSISAGAGPFGIVARDWNGDGRLDLAVSHFIGNTVGIRLGNGAGGFGAMSSYAAPPRPRGLAAADLNADSAFDLAVSSAGSAAIAVLTGSGTGSFSAPTFLTAQDGPGAVTVADFDGNGSPDLAAANQTPGTVSVFLNQCSFVPAVSVGDCTAAEGNSGSTSCTLSVSLSNAATQTVSVTLSTADGTATSGQDYGGGVVGVSFPPGTLTQTVPVAVFGDVLDEPDETFLVHLSSPVNGTIGDGSGTGTIADDDPAPAFSIDDVAVVEGDTGAVAATFTVTTAASSQTLFVSYGTADGTAGSADYAASAGTLTFPPGTTSRAITVAVAGDVLDEPSETLFVNLSAPIGAIIADGQGVGTITDNDPAAELSIGDASVVEGNAGSANAAFTVSTPPSGQTITVAYQTAAASAGAGDFTAASGTLTFTPGTASLSIEVPVTADLVVELDETFTVNLSGASGAPILDGQGLGTIVDDDAPSLSGVELSHGSRHVYTLAPPPPASAPDVDFFRLAQKPHSSYEVVMDATSGDIGPPSLDRLGADNVTVVQTGAATGPGGTRVLRWENRLAVPVTSHHLRVRSGGCGTDCGADDEYRIRAYETTAAIPRFNNSGTQVTVLIVHNPTAQTVSGTAWFWSLTGSPLGHRAFTLTPKATLVLNTGTVAGLVGKSGTITVAHDAGYGGLTGKAVALEPATGFSFDSPMVPRPH